METNERVYCNNVPFSPISTSILLSIMLTFFTIEFHVKISVWNWCNNIINSFFERKCWQELILSAADCETSKYKGENAVARDGYNDELALTPRAFYFYDALRAHAGLMPYITRLPAMLLNYIIQINFTARWIEAEDTLRAMISILTALNFPLRKIPLTDFVIKRSLSFSLSLLVEYNNHTAARAREISLANIYYAPDLRSAVDDYHSSLFAVHLKEVA